MANSGFNLIKISNFPELTNLLSSDKIILFQTVNGNIVPDLSSVADLSSVILFPENMDEVTAKVDQVKGMITDAINYLRKNFITTSDAAAMYATITQLNTAIEKLESVQSFKERLSDRADKEYLEYFANRIKANIYGIKYNLGTGSWDGGKGRGYKKLLVAKAGVKE